MHLVRALSTPNSLNAPVPKGARVLRLAMSGYRISLGRFLSARFSILEILDHVRRIVVGRDDQGGQAHQEKVRGRAEMST